MITEAIWDQKHYMKGESRESIWSWIRDNYEIIPADYSAQLKPTLSKMLKEGSAGYPCLIRKDDNYKLHPEWRKEWCKKYGKKHKRQNRKPKDPNLPKHPRSAWLYFTIELRPRRSEQNPEKSMTELTTMLSKEWKAMGPQKKKKYEDMAKKDKDRYEREKKQYLKKKKYESDDSSNYYSYEKKKRKRRSDSEESKSHSAKKRRSKGKSESRSMSRSDSESSTDDKKKKRRGSTKTDEGKDQKPDKSEKPDSSEKPKK